MLDLVLALSLIYVDQIENATWAHYLGVCTSFPTKVVLSKRYKNYILNARSVKVRGYDIFILSWD